MKPADDPSTSTSLRSPRTRCTRPSGRRPGGPKNVFLRSGPEYSGGGTVNIVTTDEVYWRHAGPRGSGKSNVVGAVAMAAAAERSWRSDGECARPRARASRRDDEALRRRARIKIYGERDPARAGDKVGVIPFNLEGKSHFLVAAVLDTKADRRSQRVLLRAPYVVHLLGLAEEELRAGATST